MITSEVLNKAADLIEERGWVKGEGWPGVNAVTSRLCLEGGIMAALGWTRDEAPARIYSACPAYEAVVAYLGRKPAPKTAPIVDSLWAWNDAEGRTAAEVIEVLRATAVIEAARETETAQVSA